jgi:hypothetical protein
MRIFKFLDGASPFPPVDPYQENTEEEENNGYVVFKWNIHKKSAGK